MESQERPVLPYAPGAAVAGAIVGILVIVAFLAFGPALFPGRVSGPLRITVAGFGPSRAAATGDLAARRAELTAYLAERGISPDRYALRADSVGEEIAGPKARTILPGQHMYQALQEVVVAIPDYRSAAHLANSIAHLDRGRYAFEAAFPMPPFMRLIVVLLVITLLLLVVAPASTETRNADVSRAPRGMHPLMVIDQTLLLAALICSSIAYVHLAAEIARTLYIAVILLGVGALVYWLVRTRASWVRAGMAAVFWCYVGALVATIAVFAYTLTINFSA